MKKLLSVFFTFCICLLTPLMLCSCDNHKFAKEWSSNETSHWHACVDQDCLETSDMADHTYNEGEVEGNTKTYTCTVCGATKQETIEHSHEFSTEWSKDADNHWKVCLDDTCEEVSELSAHTYNEGVVEGTTKIYTCTVCGATKQETVGPTHNVATEWSKDENSHWHICLDDSCDERLDLASHTYDAGVVEGERVVFTCTVCGATRVQTIEHQHSFSIEWSKDENYHWKECLSDTCEEISELAEHSFDKSVVEGTTQKFICTVCGATKSEGNNAEDDNLIYLEALEKFATESYTLKLSDFTLNYDGNFSIDFATLNIFLNENGELVGHGTCNVLNAETGALIAKATAIIADNAVYVNSNGTSVGDDQDFTYKIMISDLINQIIFTLENTYDIDFESILKNISQNDFNDAINAILESYSSSRIELNTVLGLLVNEFFNCSISEDTITYSFNFEALKQINNTLNSIPVSILFNSIFGENAYNDFSNTLVASVDMSIDDFITALEENGIKLEDVLTNLDLAAAKVGPILVASSGKVDGQTPVVITTFEQLLTALGYELPFEDLGEFLNLPEVRKIRVYEILNQLTQNNYSAVDYKMIINAVLVTYGDMSIYQILEANLDHENPLPAGTIFNMVNDKINMLSQVITFSYTTDKNGIILTGAIDLVVPELVQGKLELIKDFETEIDYNSLLDEYRDLINSLTIKVSSLPLAVEGYSRDISTNIEEGTFIVTYISETGDSSTNNFYSQKYEFVFVNGVLSQISDLYEMAYYNSLVREFNLINIVNNEYSIMTYESSTDNVYRISFASSNGVCYRYSDYNGCETEEFFPVANIEFDLNIESNQLIFINSL